MKGLHLQGLSLEAGLRLGTAISFSPSCSSVSRSAEQGAGAEPETSDTQTETDFLLSKQGRHVESAAANGLWPDLHPKPCPKPDCKEQLAQGPASSRTAAIREHGQQSSVCWALSSLPSASAWCWDQAEMSPGFGILSCCTADLTSFLEPLGITLL